MKENQNIEFKESWRDEYIKWICGFANASGGVLVIGKNDKGVVTSVINAKKHPSKPYNPLIANAFFRAGLIESWGRGIQKINSNITIPELAEKVAVTERSVERNLQSLQKEGLIERVGPAKGGYWKVIMEKK